MKQGIVKAFFLAICISFFVILICGCKEEMASSEKRSRVIAAENIELQKQLSQKDKEIEQLKGALEKCNAEKKEEKERMNTEMNGVTEIIEDVFTENEQLRKENEQLKKQIEELKSK